LVYRDGRRKEGRVWWEIVTVSENETSAIIDLHWKERAGI
jgi:hypothetical protein